MDSLFQIFTIKKQGGEGEEFLRRGTTDLMEDLVVVVIYVI